MKVKYTKRKLWAEEMSLLWPPQGDDMVVAQD